MLNASDKQKHFESLSQRRELRDAAKALLADQAFSHVYWKLHQQWYAVLIHQPHDGPRQAEAAARLRAIEDFLLELAVLLEERRDSQRLANG